jgi:hypothetical protein
LCRELVSNVDRPGGGTVGTQVFGGSRSTIDAQ